MDSGNSGSLQSSSGGDEEYDSRGAADSISTFFNTTISTTTAGGAASFNQLPPPPPPPLHHQALFDSFSFLDSNLNLEIPWTSRPPPPPPPNLSSTDVPTLIPSPLPRPAIPATQPPPSDHPSLAVRPSKKRSRASRRAPTTVLTTDTSNFRAMVQEFTGIPSPPFASSSSSSPFSRSRFDLFRSAVSDRSPPAPYILRPFANKFPQAAMTMPTTASNLCTASTSNPAPAPTANYQLPSPDLGRHDTTPGLLNIQNPAMLNFHPFLQPSLSPKYNSISKPLVPAIPADHGSYDQGDVNGVMGLPTLTAGMQPRGRREEMSAGWSAPEEVSQAQFRPVVVTGSSQKGASCKMNLAAVAATSSEFGNDKVSDNAPARGTEGMMESWICSSD